MTYIINKWHDANSDGVSCIFRTDNLEAWLKGIVGVKKKYKITPDKCRWQESGSGTDKVAIFSFYTDSARYSWLESKHTKKPNFIFMGFPEGVKYYE